MATEDGRNKRDGAAVGPRWLRVKGVRDSSYGVLIKPDLLRQAVAPTFILANPTLTSRARTFPSTSLRPSLYLSEVLSRVRQLEVYICVCSALKHYPRFTRDPIRLLKKLRDWKRLRYVGTKLRVTRFRRRHAVGEEKGLLLAFW